MKDARGSDSTFLSGHMPALDGLRGCAILLVLLLHFTLRQPVIETAGVHAIRNVFALGWSGVDLFFVLSGFLITGLLFDAKGSDGYFRIFYARRGLRILPLYYGALVAVFVVPYFLGSRINPADVTPLGDQLLYWAYLQNYHELRGVQGEFLDAFWTLAIEEQFYLVWPLVIFLSTRKQALWICGTCIVSALVYRSVMIGLGYSPEAIGHLTPARFDALAVGSAIALMVRGPSGFSLAKKLSVPAILFGVVVLAGTLVKAGPTYHRDALMLTLGFSAIPFAYGGILVRALTSAGVFARALRSAALRFFGRYSYGLYVIHLPVTIVFAKAGVVPYQFAGISTPALALACYTIFMLIVCIGCAWLVFHLYERRFLSLKQYVSYDRKTRSELVAPVGASDAALQSERATS